MVDDTKLQTAFRTASDEEVQERLRTAVADSFAQVRGTPTRAACRESYAAETFAAATMAAGMKGEAPATLAALVRFFGQFGGLQEVATIREVMKRNGSLEVWGACLRALRTIGGASSHTLLQSFTGTSTSDAVRRIARSELSKLASRTTSSYREFIDRNPEPSVLRAAQFGVLDGGLDVLEEDAGGFLQSPHSVAALRNAGFKVLSR